MLVTTENLSIGYRNYIVQSNLNLVVENGDLICMLGTNGCGKSTLLRTLAGLQPSLAGKVLLLICLRRISILFSGLCCRLNYSIRLSAAFQSSRMANVSVS